MERYCIAAQATDDNMAHAHCRLDTQGYKHTHSEYVIPLAFPLQQWLHERPQSYVIRTLPVLLSVKPDDTLSDH